MVRFEHLGLLVVALLVFQLLSGALHKKKIEENSKQTDSDAAAVPISVALGFGWWAAFGLVYLAMWHSMTSRSETYKFWAMSGIFFLFVLGFTFVTMLPLPIMQGVYARYGLSFVGPIILMIVVFFIYYGFVRNR